MRTWDSHQRPTQNEPGRTTETPTKSGSRRALTFYDSSSPVLRLGSAVDDKMPPVASPRMLAAAQHGISGTGGSLPHLNEIQRSFGRHDLSLVRAYQDSRAAQTARSIAARAYTIGDQVAFSGKPDLHTAAHEAAHVVQQRAGVHLRGEIGEAGDSYERHADAVADLVVRGRSAESLLDQMTPLGSQALGIQRQVLQRAPIKTNFGEFDTTTYTSLGSAGSEYGVSIELTFDPDRAKVNAKKIGLVQTARSQLGGVAAAISPTAANRTVKTGAGEGRRIDRTTSGAYGNPLYATGVPAATDTLPDTATDPGWGQHGWNFTDSSGTPQHQTATLIDAPTLPGRGNNSSQIFETTALAVEGTQSGTYMGSVQWGWRVDGSGAFTKLPLTRISKGNPSAAFIAAARKWNTSLTAGTIKAAQNPTNVYDAAYSVAFTVARDTEVQITANGLIHNNLFYSEVNITSGPETGRSGRIKANDLKDTGGGTATIDLPIP